MLSLAAVLITMEVLGMDIFYQPNNERKFFSIIVFSSFITFQWQFWIEGHEWKKTVPLFFLFFFHQKVKINYCLPSSTLSRVKRIGKLCTKSCLSLTLINENIEIMKNLQFIFHIFYYLLEYACSFLVNNFFQNHLIW